VIKRRGHLIRVNGQLGDVLNFEQSGQENFAGKELSVTPFHFWPEVVSTTS